MLLSRTSEYALQALIYLATHGPGQLVLSREIAAYLSVPPQYLAKILQDMAKRGVVNSYKGRGGGFALRPEALSMPILEVLALVEGNDVFKGCLLGLKKCSDETACPVHHAWVPLKQQVLAMLAAHDIESMANAVKEGRYRLRTFPALDSRLAI